MPRKDLENYPKKVGYKKHPGMVAWLAHRITGVVIGLFLIFHILAKGGYAGWFDALTNNLLVHAIILIFFLFHALNGFRIVIMDFGNGAEKEVFGKQLGGAVGLMVVFFIIGIIAII